MHSMAAVLYRDRIDASYIGDLYMEYISAIDAFILAECAYK